MPVRNAIRGCFVKLGEGADVESERLVQRTQIWPVSGYVRSIASASPFVHRP